MNPDKIQCLGHTIYHTDRCQDCRRDFYNQFCPDYVQVNVIDIHSPQTKPIPDGSGEHISLKGDKTADNPIPRECQGLMRMLEVDDG